MAVAVLAGVAAAVPAVGALYPDQTKINLFQHFDRTTGNQLVTGSSPHQNPMPLVDGSYSGTQVNGSGSRWDFDLSLDQARAASKLVVVWTGYHPDSFSILYRAADADPWTVLITNETSQMTTHQDTWQWTLPGGANGTPIKTLRFIQNPSTVDNYIRMNEIYLFAAANSTYDDEEDGFNLLANRSVLGTITAPMIHSENPANGLDNDPMTGWIRPYGSPPPSWYVVPLTRTCRIWGVNLGFYDNWGNCFISYSDAAVMPDAATNGVNAFVPPAGWTAAYSNAAAQGPAFIKLATVATCRWVRVQFDGGNALSEMELFSAPIPPPPKGTAILMR
jgi:hypothetical protein